MQGKKIKDTFDFTGDYTLIMFDDGTASLVKLINAELAKDEIKELNELIGGKPEKEASTKSDKKDKGKGKDKPTWEELKEMDHGELSKLVKAGKLDVKPKEFDGDEADEMLDFAKEVAEEMEIEVVDGDDKYTWDDLVKMDFDELIEVIDDEDLDELDEKDYDEDEKDDELKLRVDVATELEIPVPAKIQKKRDKLD